MKHQVLLSGCRCVEIDVWDGEPKSKFNEEEQKVGGDKRKHAFKAQFNKLSSHGPFKHFRKEKSSSTSSTSDESVSLNLPTPWTSASTAMRAEPRVLHGYTLTKEVPFRDVCMAIKDAAFVNRYVTFRMLWSCVDVDIPSDLPVIASFEVHAGAEQQEIMVEIIKSVWKDHLIKTFDPDATCLPSPESLRNKILVKVKYINPNEAAAVAKDQSPDKRETIQSMTLSSSESEDDDAPAEVKKEKKKSSVVPSLSALGIYTQAYHFKSLSAPEAVLPMHVFSLNEKKLMEVHSSCSGLTIFSHNKNYLMRAFPSGTRVRSDNLDPAPFWRKGVQMVALNWQRWDQGMMLNKGMFVGSQGYVLKPEGYRSRHPSTLSPAITTETQSDATKHWTLDLLITVLAAQDIPLPLGDNRPEAFHPYVKCELHVEKPAERTGAPIEGGGKTKEGEFKWISKTMKGIEVDFEEEDIEFKNIPGVVEELCFIRYAVTLSVIFVIFLSRHLWENMIHKHLDDICNETLFEFNIANVLLQIQDPRRRDRQR